MSTERFSQLLHSISDRKDSLFYPGQALLISTLAYIGTAFTYLPGLLSVSPLHGAIYVLTAMTIHEISKPLFIKMFKPIEKDSLAPSAYKFVKWTFSLLSAKLICALFGIAISMSQIALIGIGFCVAFRIAKTIVKKMRESAKEPHVIPIRR